MKKALFFITTMGSSLLCSPVFSQAKETPDSLGLPGDNLNLYGVLDVFQKSATLEEFEKKLNAEDSKINNLDLNGNNKIDYISVIDNVKGNAHAIVLQVAVSEKENQDVAVIEVEKDKNDKVQIQVVGDEQLYGKNYIIEPKDKDESSKNKSGGTPNPGYTGTEKSTTVTNTTNNYYNSNNSNNVYDYNYPVGSWSIVRYMYYPTYVVYVSPWRWGYYPGYWNPWAPLFWHSYYYDYHYPHYHHYYGYYHRSYNYRNTIAHNYYGQRRTTSATVNQRRESGEYRKTYSRPDLATKQITGGQEGKRSNPAIDNTRQGKTVPQKETISERTASPKNNTIERNVQPGNTIERNTPSKNDNRVNNSTKESKKPSSPVKTSRSEQRHNVNSAPHSAPKATPRAGSSKPNNSGNSGGRKK